MNEVKSIHKTSDDVREEKHTTHTKEPPAPPAPPAVEPDKRFLFPVLKTEQQPRSAEIQQKASELAKLILTTPTGSKDKERALYHLDEVVLWANVDLVRNG